MTGSPVPPLTAAQLSMWAPTDVDAVLAQAEAAGFVLATLDDQGAGRLHATIQAARPAALSRWLARLEAGGLLIEQATWRDNGDGSVAADLVVRARGA